MAIPPPDLGALKCERQRSLAELSILVVAETECQRRVVTRDHVSVACVTVPDSICRPAAVFTGVFGLFPKISTTVENTVENIEGLLS